MRRHYTPELANRSLPLVRRIVTDVQQVAREIQRAWQQAREAQGEARTAHEDRLHALRQSFEALTSELTELGVELKDPLTGLIDFRAQRGEQEVYLCWRLGEDAVDHWHGLETGFAGRRPLSEY